MTYGWPVEPFGEQHPIRGFFCDPRIGRQGQQSIHFGVDVSAPDGTPVYAVQAGTVHYVGGENVAVMGATELAYWHVVVAVRHGQHVAQHALIGHVARTWGHVHLAERRGGRYWNPLRRGALAPYLDGTVPTVDRIVVSQRGAAIDPRSVTGVVGLIAEAHDRPPLPVAPPWHGLPVTPALLRWRLVRFGREVVPWTVATDFRTTLAHAQFGQVYAPGTRQNHANAPGLYRFWLSHGWDSRRHPDGRYRLDVEASDTRGNSSRGHLDLVLVNGQV